MASKEIEAGRAVVVLSLKDKLGQALTQIEKRWLSFGSTVSDVGGKIAGVGVGVTAAFGSVVGVFGAAASSFAKAGSELQDMANRTGIAAKSLSALSFAAKQSGTNADELEGGLRRMQATIGDAAAGSQSALKKFSDLGIEFDKLARLAPDQQFAEISAKIATIKDPTLRAAAALDIFGKTGTKLLPMITSNVKELLAEAEKLGVVFSDDDIRAAAALDDAYEKLAASLGMLFQVIGASVAGPLTAFTESLASILGAASQVVSINRGVVASIAGISVGGVAAGAAITALGVSILGLGAIISAGSSIVGLFSTVIGAIGAPVIGTVAAIVGAVAVATAVVGSLFAYIGYQAGTFSELFQVVSTAVAPIITAMNEVYGAVTRALSTGDYALAAQVLWAGIKVIFWEGMRGALQAFQYLFRNAVRMTFDFIKTYYKLLWDFFKSIPSLMLAALRGGASFADALSKIMTGKMDLASTVEAPLRSAREELKALMDQANGQLQATPRPQQSPLSRVPSPPPQVPPSPMQVPARPLANPQQNMAPPLAGKAPSPQRPMTAQEVQQMQARHAWQDYTANAESFAKSQGQPGQRPAVNVVAAQQQAEQARRVAEEKAQAEREAAISRGQQIASVQRNGVASAPKVDSRGTFSAAAATAFGNRSNAQEATARNTAMANRLLRVIADKRGAQFS